MLAKAKGKIITNEEREILLDNLGSIGHYEISHASYISSIASKNMFVELKITTEMKDEILKQHKMLSTFGYKLKRILLPSCYGSQQDNWVETYNFNDFVNDIIANDIKDKFETYKSWGDEPDNDEKEIVSHHQMIKRDRKLNILIDDRE